MFCSPMGTCCLTGNYECIIIIFQAFRQATRPSEVGVVKTIVEGGATIEVTSQDMSDSEEDEENVYSVKVNIINTRF